MDVQIDETSTMNAGGRQALGRFPGTFRASPAAGFPRTAVVTGATSGFGRALAGALAKAGTELVLLGRDARRAEATLQALREEAPATSVTMILADLSSRTEVHRAVDEILDRMPEIELLVNNAGGLAGIKRSESVDGIESTLALNHLAYFELTRRLESRLRAGAAGRIVNVASDAYEIAGGPFDFDDPQARRRYRVHRQYGLSKLANLLFTRELARRLSGSGVEAVAWSPKGLTATRFAYNANRLAPIFMKLAHPFSLSVESASESLIELCRGSIPSARLGGFNLGGEWRDVSVCCDEDAERLWQLSLEWIGVGQ